MVIEMRGLQVFVSDLKSAKEVKEQQKRIQAELVNIKRQFCSGNLSGYQRKKYVAKLAYIYVTTNGKRISEIKFGIEQCLVLLASGNYSEKFIGYMTLELFMYHDEIGQDVLFPVINQLKSDLHCGSEDFVALALNFIGVTGAGYKSLCNELFYEVLKILKSRDSSFLLKSKSALAFLAMMRKAPDLFTERDDETIREWVQCIFAQLDYETNYGMILSVLPLIEFIAINVSYDESVKLIPKLVQILYRCIVIANEQPSLFPREYKFANMPNPWIIVNIVRILNVLITSTNANAWFTLNNIDQQSLVKLRMCVVKAIDLPSGRGNRNSPTVRFAILLSLIKLAYKLEFSDDAISSWVSTFYSLVMKGDVNIRYLAWGPLMEVYINPGKRSLELVRKNFLPKLFDLLKAERDMSIVRKILDFIYLFAEEEYSVYIVENLLQYIQGCLKRSGSLKNDVCIKLYGIVERYSGDLNWFTRSSVKLVSLLNYENLNEGDELWMRLCRKVVSNKPLHKPISEELVKYLSQPNPSEAIVRTSAYILGEYAQLITDTISIGDLFNLLAERYINVDSITRGMILTTIVRFYSYDRLIGTSVIKFLRLELNSLDAELQLRAFQYINIVQLCNMRGYDTSLIDTLLGRAPPFMIEAESPAEQASLEENVSALSIQGNDSTFSTTLPPKTPATPSPPSRNYKISYSSVDLTDNWKSGFGRMLRHKQGIFYKDSSLTIIYRFTQDAENPYMSTIKFTTVNNSEEAITGYNPELICIRTDNSPPYVLTSVEVGMFTIATKERSTFSFDLQTRHVFSITEAPIYYVNFRIDGVNKELHLKLGYGVLSAMKEGVKMLLPQFIQRWHTINDTLGKEGEFQQVLPSLELKQVELTLKRMSVCVVKQTTVAGTVFASGIVYTKSDGNFGFLIKAKRENRDLVLTCKTTMGGTLSQYILESVVAAIDD